MRINVEKCVFWLRWALVALMAGTVIFIFVNSMLPPEKSAEQSGTIGEIIGEIIPPDTTVGGFIQEYLRKIAHFTEYGLLGIELATYVIFFTKRRVRCGLLGLTVPFFVGFLDESIQILSDRGPSISDVWIDVGGFITFSLVAYGIGALIVFTALRLRRGRTEKTE